MRSLVPLVTCFGSILAAQQTLEKAEAHPTADEPAIRLLVQQREAAWNSGDVIAYERLLTPDADSVSGTGRSADGRDAILALYKEQRAGIYRGAITSTPVQSIRFLRPDVAIVNTRTKVTRMHDSDRSIVTLSEGSQILVVTKSQGRWSIAAIRSWHTQSK